MYFALIQPHFDYCCFVWDGLGETLSTKIQKLQNRAVRVITRSSYDTSASVLLNPLQLDNLSLRRKKVKTSLMFKILKGHMPFYYMDKGILLATKTLVESIRHYIRDPSGVFPYVTLASGISINSRLFCCFFFQNGRRVQGLWSWAKTTFITFANNKKMLICL